MSAENKLYGLVVCGGKSARMGFDKSLLIYHDKPIRFHLYELLESFCNKVFISCNSSQSKDTDNKHNILTDLPDYENIGPMAALLTAFAKFPDKDFLVIGCDYPFLTEKELKKFLSSVKELKLSAAFYNAEANLYEPMLAFYTGDCAKLVRKLYEKKEYSLQHFLKKIDAEKYFPSDVKIITSADTPEESAHANEVLKNQNN